MWDPPEQSLHHPSLHPLPTMPALWLKFMQAYPQNAYTHTHTCTHTHSVQPINAMEKHTLSATDVLVQERGRLRHKYIFFPTTSSQQHPMRGSSQSASGAPGLLQSGFTPNHPSPSTSTPWDNSLSAPDHGTSKSMHALDSWLHNHQ